MRCAPFVWLDRRLLNCFSKLEVTCGRIAFYYRYTCVGMKDAFKKRIGRLIGIIRFELVSFLRLILLYCYGI
jgi:hypothetical protein